MSQPAQRSAPPADVPAMTDAPIIVALYAAASFIFLWNLGNPPMLFWDENYHLAAAHKYLAGMMFMEPHPPLGKLLIALSEWLLGANAQLPHDAFLATDHVSTLPPGYSMLPGRLPAALCALLATPVFFGILRRVGLHSLPALCFTGFYLLETGMIYQVRAAQLEGIQNFFILCAVWKFLGLWDRPHPLRSRDYTLLGLLIGLACAVKLNSFIILPLPAALWLRQHGAALKMPPLNPHNRKLIANGIRAMGSALAAALCVIIACYYIHIGLGRQMMNGNKYQASPAYVDLMNSGDSSWNPLTFWLKLRDNIAFIPHYENGAPDLKWNSPTENGSYPLRWLAGGKSINGRWDKADGYTRYLAFVANPVAWGAGFAGLCVGIILLGGIGLGEANSRNRRSTQLMAVFLGLWLAYMAVMLHLRRVMYVYHYLIPLFFTWIIAALAYHYLLQGKSKQTQRRCLAGLLAVALANVASFAYFAPFAYHLPITYAQCEAREWTMLWEILCTK